MEILPEAYVEFMKKYPDVKKGFESLGTACHEAGPLDEKTRRLVKLGIAVGARLEGGVHAQVRMARREKISDEEIRHCVVLALTTIGLPSTVAAMTWAEDTLGERQPV